MRTPEPFERLSRTEGRVRLSNIVQTSAAVECTRTNTVAGRTLQGYVRASQEQTHSPLVKLSIVGAGAVGSTAKENTLGVLRVAFHRSCFSASFQRVNKKKTR